MEKPTSAPRPVILDPRKEEFMKIFQTPRDARDEGGQQLATVGGVVVDLTSPEYAAWYAEHYG